MNLRQIEVFRAVMATGSTTDAARLLHVSQPGVSRLIRHLELRLGVSLFERRKGRLVPTHEAQTLYTEVERVHRGVRHVQSVAAQLKSGNQGTLRVLTSANTSLQLVPMAVAALVEAMPAVRVHVETLPTREIVALMVAEQADIAVTSAPLDHPSLQVTEMGRWSLVCAVHRDHRLATSRTLPLGEALRERLVVYSPEAPQSAVIGAWLARRRVSPDVAVEVRSGYAACAMAAAGVGIAFVDDLSARAHRPECVRFIPVPKTPTFPIFSVVNLNRPPSRAGRHLLALAARVLISLQRTPPVPGASRERAPVR